MTTDVKSNVFSAHDFIQYQKDSIVSKILLDNEGGTVTLFSFDEGQGLSEHTTPFDVLLYVIDGKAEITISGKPFLLKDGEMIIMPAHKPHAVKAVEKFKMVLTMLKS